MKLLVITITLRDSIGLLRTLKSLDSCDSNIFSNILIKDGASDPITSEIASKFNKLPIVLLDTPDVSIFNAMNICIDYARSNRIIYDYCVFINSGDEFIYDFDMISQADLNDPKPIIFSASSVVFSDGKKINYPNISKVKNISEFNIWLERFNPVHQSVWFPKSTINSIKYDEEFKIQADTKYIFTAIRDCNYIFVPKITSIFYADGLSSNYKNMVKVSRQAAEQFFIELCMKKLPMIKGLVSLIKFCLKYFLWRIFGEAFSRKVHSLYIRYIK